MIALVTGSSRGIGAATAILLAEQGYAVCINYRQNAAAARSIQEIIQAKGGRCILAKADVSLPQDVDALFHTIDELLGPITLLVNNVGILKPQMRLVDMTPDRIAEVLNTNILSCILCSQHAIKRMSTQRGGKGGVIVNVSSGAAKTGSPNEYIDYAASKGAIDALTRGLAMEVATEGIRVNAVRPGMIYTDIHRDGGEAQRVDRLVTKIPVGRGGDPRDVAEAIAWLASEKSSYVTGSFIDCTGGV